MSKAHIETDEQRKLREAATVVVGKNNHGHASHAVNVIDPSGHLSQVAVGTKLKDGWRYATAADLKLKADAEKARKAAELDAAK